MLGIVVAVGFMGMVLSPSAVTLYNKYGWQDGKERTTDPEGDSTQPAVPAQSAVSVQPAIPAPRTVDTTINDLHTRRPVPLSTSPLPTPPPTPMPRPAPLQPVPSLRQIAEEAAREAIRAQAEAAQARVIALREVSREASRRADAAAKLAEAAEHELLRASQASLQAQQAKQRARVSQANAADRDYLPHDHPSLDFPRSRVPSRRLA